MGEGIGLAQFGNFVSNKSGRDEATKKTFRLDEQFSRSLAFASHNLGFLI